MIMMYGTLFMMAGAYTLSKNGHVRGDVLYGFFPPRLQAGLDLTLYLLFFIPGIVALVWAGYYYRRRFLGDQRALQRHRRRPAALSLQDRDPDRRRDVLLQGFVEIVRCVICLRKANGHRAIEDVEEVDVEKLKEMVHVKDEDIQALDKLVVAAGEHAGETNEMNKERRGSASP